MNELLIVEDVKFEVDTEFNELNQYVTNMFAYILFKDGKCQRFNCRENPQLRNVRRGDLIMHYSDVGYKPLWIDFLSDVGQKICQVWKKTHCVDDVRALLPLPKYLDGRIKIIRFNLDRESYCTVGKHFESFKVGYVTLENRNTIRVEVRKLPKIMFAQVGDLFKSL